MGPFISYINKLPYLYKWLTTRWGRWRRCRS